VTELERALRLLWMLVDSDPCWFDHNGDCQAHGWFGLTREEPCPHEEAKRQLRSYGVDISKPDWPGLAHGDQPIVTTPAHDANPGQDACPP
jgi:hypothetical protein